jgi:hypothetical protein
MTKDEALTMCLEYIETDKHERKYVRHAIKAALEQPVQEPVARVAEVHMSRYTVEWTNGPIPEGTELFSAQPPLPVQEPVAYDETEMNSFLIDLYEEKMKEGKHGHYEAMFHCVHQAIKRAAHGIKENT